MTDETKPPLEFLLTVALAARKRAEATGEAADIARADILDALTGADGAALEGLAAEARKMLRQRPPQARWYGSRLPVQSREDNAQAVRRLRDIAERCHFMLFNARPAGSKVSDVAFRAHVASSLVEWVPAVGLGDQPADARADLKSRLAEALQRNAPPSVDELVSWALQACGYTSKQAANAKRNGARSHSSRE